MTWKWIVTQDGNILVDNDTNTWILTDDSEHGSGIDTESREARLIAAAPEMYELLRRFIVDDKWGVSMRADLEAARRAAELLRRLED